MNRPRRTSGVGCQNTQCHHRHGTNSTARDFEGNREGHTFFLKEAFRGALCAFQEAQKCSHDVFTKTRLVPV